MAGKAILKETFRKNVIRDMKSLKTYKPEYEPVIGIYCELYEQYNKLTKKYTSCDFDDASIAKRLEALRKDLILYSDRLGLNPKGFDSLDVPKPTKKQSALVIALNKATDAG